MTGFWHPFADMAAVVANGATILERGEGAYVWDSDGRRYLDATASLWYCNVGWGRSEIAEAATVQLGKLPAYSAFGDLPSRPAEELAAKVAAGAREAGTFVPARRRRDRGLAPARRTLEDLELLHDAFSAGLDAASTRR
jgi:putrescine aminotransferase